MLPSTETTASADKELATRLMAVLDAFEQRFSLLENYSNVIVKNTVLLRSDFLVMLAKIDDSASCIGSACRQCEVGTQTLVLGDVQIISHQPSNKVMVMDGSSFENGVHDYDSVARDDLAQNGDVCNSTHHVNDANDSFFTQPVKKNCVRVDHEISVPISEGMSNVSQIHSGTNFDFGETSDVNIGLAPTASKFVEECAHSAASNHPIRTAKMTSHARIPSSEWRGNDSMSAGCSCEESRESSLELNSVHSPRPVSPNHRRHRLNSLLEQQMSRPSWSKYLKQHIFTITGWRHLWCDMVKWVFGIQPRNTPLGIEGSKIIDPFSPFHGGDTKLQSQVSANISNNNFDSRC
jgi:hypothetical protein